jgi:hypothetical protein
VVKAGQVYRYRPANKGAHLKYLKITRVSRGMQPKASYRLITRSGRRKQPSHSQVVWLTWDGKQWAMPYGELIESI